MTRNFTMLPILAALLTSGCLQKETTHTLYIEPGGAVEWVAVERTVHSDLQERAAREAEEQAYIRSAAENSHDIARALLALGPEGPIMTRVARAHRPYTVITNARYDSLERVLARLFHESGLPAVVSLSTADGQTTLTIALDFRAPEAGRESPVDALLHDVDRFGFVLTDGTFVAATGFQFGGVEARLTEAWLKEAAAACEEGTTIALSLTWTTGG
ncbi:MAG TPA: hypothetical protein VM364_20105 [Vicinamibacterales bacterium]|nr:hypothetical protein [Vicinamibacterales bacterium]